MFSLWFLSYSCNFSHDFVNLCFYIRTLLHTVGPFLELRNVHKSEIVAAETSTMKLFCFSIFEIFFIQTVDPLFQYKRWTQILVTATYTFIREGRDVVEPAIKVRQLRTNWLAGCKLLCNLDVKGGWCPAGYVGLVKQKVVKGLEFG